MVSRIERLENLVDYLLNLTDKRRLLGQELTACETSVIIDEWLNGKKKNEVNTERRG